MLDCNEEHGSQVGVFDGLPQRSRHLRIRRVRARREGEARRGPREGSRLSDVDVRTSVVREAMKHASKAHVITRFELRSTST